MYSLRQKSGMPPEATVSATDGISPAGFRVTGTTVLGAGMIGGPGWDGMVGGACGATLGGVGVRYTGDGGADGGRTMALLSTFPDPPRRPTT